MELSHDLSFSLNVYIFEKLVKAHIPDEKVSSWVAWQLFVVKCIIFDEMAELLRAYLREQEIKALELVHVLFYLCKFISHVFHSK